MSRLNVNEDSVNCNVMRVPLHPNGVNQTYFLFSLQVRFVRNRGMEKRGKNREKRDEKVPHSLEKEMSNNNLPQEEKVSLMTFLA